MVLETVCSALSLECSEVDRQEDISGVGYTAIKVSRGGNDVCEVVVYSDGGNLIFPAKKMTQTLENYFNRLVVTLLKLGYSVSIK